MAGNYTVQQGDHLSKIAHQFGFSSYKTIWDHPNNSELKNKRKNPNVLFPGDAVFIPDRDLRQEDRSTDKKHTFVKKVTGLKLRMTLYDQFEKPIANASCILSVDGSSRTVTTTSQGRLDEAIEPGAAGGFLMIQDSCTPFKDILIDFRIGDLDPVDEVSGQVARLNNLGYGAGALDSPDEDTFESAVEEFQCDQGLTVDGICGPKTQAELKKVHGC